MTSNIKLTSVFLALCTMLTMSCDLMNPIVGSDIVIEKEYDNTAFNSLEFSHAFQVKIKQEEEFQILLKFNDNLEEYVEVEQKGETLSIGLDDGKTYKNAQLIAEISLPDLQNIGASGACEIELNKLTTSVLDLDVSGASEVFGKVKIMDKLLVDASGASQVDLKGKSNNAEIMLSGASQFGNEKFTVQDRLKIECSGASESTVNVKGEIEAEITGASIFNYSGKATFIEKEVSGAGIINQLK